MKTNDNIITKIGIIVITKKKYVLGFEENFSTN